jgi:thioredoxin-related protein
VNRTATLFLVGLVLILLLTHQPPKPQPSPVTPAVKNALWLVESDNCPWCVKQEKALGETDLSPFNHVIRRQKGDNGPIKNVTAYPTLAILSPAGTELKRHTGYLPPDQLSSWLKDQ